MDPLLETFIAEIKSFTGCEAVGVRVLDEQGNIPYKAYTGFCSELYELEKNLSVKLDKCVCIDVITGNRNASTLEYYSEYGSFSIGSIKRHRATHPPLVPIGRKQMRGNCTAFGYDSLTMIPILYGDHVLGLIHIADSRPDMVPPDKLGILEKVAMQLGVALSRVLMEQEVLNYQNTLETKVFEKTNELQQLNSQLNKELEEKRRITNALLASEKRVQSLINSYINAQDEEREWLSLEIHDRVVQPMSAVFHQLQSVAPKCSRKPLIRQGVDRAIELADEVINETRNMMKELHPSTLDRYGLEKLINDELSRLKKDISCNVKYSSNLIGKRTNVIENTIYRVFHEALLNVIKHSHATHVSVDLREDGKYLTLEVTDDGIGFNCAAMSEGPGGLVCMRRRTELLGGTFSISSQPEKGTTVTSRLPY